MVTKTMDDREKKIQQWSTFIVMALILTLTMLLIVTPGFADGDANATVKSILKSMVSIVGLVFQAVGIMLSVYSVGQLVLAFKNEDADSKTRATTMLVVGVILIALPTIIDALKLTDKLTQTVDVGSGS